MSVIPPRATVSLRLGCRANHRYAAILQFPRTYANVDGSSIANTYEELGADTADRVAKSDSHPSPFLRKRSS